jgi:flagellar biosynthesis protein FliQ
MFSLLEQILRQAVERVSSQILTYAPGLLAAIFILVVTLFIAKFVRWFIIRIFKGIAVDRFLRRSGISSMIDQAGRLQTSQVVANTSYWMILVAGMLVALNSFNSELSSRLTETLVFLFPKLVAAAAIIVIGAWIGKYLGRTTLIWAVNEGVPWPRKLAAFVRALFTFGGVVVAADHLGFARDVFLAAFILVVGGIVLAASLALGLSGRESVRHYLHDRKETSEADGDDRPLWRHL